MAISIPCGRLHARNSLSINLNAIVRSLISNSDSEGDSGVVLSWANTRFTNSNLSFVTAIACSHLSVNSFNRWFIAHPTECSALYSLIKSIHAFSRISRISPISSSLIGCPSSSRNPLYSLLQSRGFSESDASLKERKLSYLPVFTCCVISSSVKYICQS